MGASDSSTAPSSGESWEAGRDPSRCQLRIWATYAIALCLSLSIRLFEILLTLYSKSDFIGLNKLIVRSRRSRGFLHNAGSAFCLLEGGSVPAPQVLPFPVRLCSSIQKTVSRSPPPFSIQPEPAFVASQWYSLLWDAQTSPPEAHRGPQPGTPQLQSPPHNPKQKHPPLPVLKI